MENVMSFDYMQLTPIFFIFVAFYFLLLRPQTKKAQQQRDMIAKIKVGDDVVTVGGVIGRVSKLLNDQEVMMRIAVGVEVRLLKSAIAQKLNDGTLENTTVAKLEPRQETKSAKKTK
jgi:preprotein translocase subunit YajC